MYFWGVDEDIIVDLDVKNTVCRFKVCELIFELKHVWTKHCIGGGRSNTSFLVSLVLLNHYCDIKKLMNHSIPRIVP